MKNYEDLNKLEIKAIVNYFDITKDSKVTFNEFSIALAPFLKAPKIDDIPSIKTYSPRRTAIAETLPPKFNESILKTDRNSKKKCSSKKGKDFSH